MSGYRLVRLRVPKRADRRISRAARRPGRHCPQRRVWTRPPKPGWRYPDWLECLYGREADVLRFLSDLRIPPTSNQAERDLRPAKTQQKISGRLRPEKAARDRYAVRGYASTAVKHGTDALTAIRDALAGNPWMLPVPEAA
jgi:hypothetical protein